MREERRRKESLQLERRRAIANAYNEEKKDFAEENGDVVIAVEAKEDDQGSGEVRASGIEEAEDHPSWRLALRRLVHHKTFQVRVCSTGDVPFVVFMMDAAVGRLRDSK